MTLRKIIFWGHLIAGVTAGLVILLMSVTGLLLAYERQITSWAEGSTGTVPSLPGTAQLPAGDLLAKFRETDSNAVPTAIIYKSAPTAAVGFNVGRERIVYANPATGEITGDGSQKTRAFFHFVTDLHRWLATEGDTRPLGKGITGAASLAFLTLIVSGLYLWWPRNWTKTSLIAVTRFQSGLSGKARDWNWHNVIGFWTCLPLLLIVLTGIIMSYTWATNLLYRITGNEPPPAKSAPSGPGTGPGQGQAKGMKSEGGNRRPAGAGPTVKAEVLNEVWSAALAHSVNWQTITLRLPNSPKASITALIDDGNGGRPDKKTTLTFDAKTGEMTNTETFASFNSGRQLRMWSRWVHTGEVIGWIGQTLAALACVGTVFLIWTGFALTWRRWKAR